MSDKVRCNVDDMALVFAQLLDEYGDRATRAVDLAVEDEAKEIRKKIRNNVGPAGIKGGAPYKGGWQIEKQTRASGVQCTVHNGGKQVGLVHLLEKGHRIVTKGKDYGSTRAFSHVAPATRDMDSELESKIRKNIELLS